MSVIKIKGSSANTGDFTIQPPNSATDRTLTLPDANGNIVSTGDTGTVATTMIANANITAAKLDGAQIGTAPIFGVRAWAEWDGSTLHAGGNVTSITFHQTGDYTVNFTTAMPNTNFAVAGLTKYDENTQYPYDANESTIALAKGRPDSNSSVRVVSVKLYTDPPEYHSASSLRIIVIA